MTVVTLSDLKLHLNIIGTDDDVLVGQKLSTAIEFVAAYTGGPLPDDVPARLNEAILLLSGHLYENRESTLVGVQAQALPFGLIDMLASYRCWTF